MKNVCTTLYHVEQVQGRPALTALKFDKQLGVINCTIHTNATGVQ